jgi:hypothetical protein
MAEHIPGQEYEYVSPFFLQLFTPSATGAGWVGFCAMIQLL